MKREKLPVGIENFEEIRREGFYYIDKTGLIRDLLNSWGKVNLFTRPRRFGKTLNMSMLKSFFEIGTDKTLFDGLAIADETALCERYMGKFPVVSVSLKSVEGLTFENAFAMLKNVIRNEAMRHYYLKESNHIAQEEHQAFEALISGSNNEGVVDSLRLLSQILYRHYGQKVILLIDEYDVPLDKAFHYGYYQEMTALIRGLFGQALKTNDYLYFAVLTGCLRVSKESIFTGLNNFAVSTIADVEYDEQFGFTLSDVNQLLKDYDLEEHFSTMKEWYDGYLFGNTNVFCPWDVINYARKLLADPDAEPQAFWINTSGNDLVKRFIYRADKTTRDEIERLIRGETIEKSVRQELTYNEIDESIDHLWSVLFTTGYLTQVGKPMGGICKLVIPNREVREVFILQIQEWFRENIVQDVQTMQGFCQAFLDGKAEDIQKYLTITLGKMISILDTKARNNQKESFYHGLLLGLLRSRQDWLILSNAESGDGFSDILIEPEDPDVGFIIEVKYAASHAGLDKSCAEAIAQIKMRRYDEKLRNDGRIHIGAYGIAFCRKRCKVVFEQL